MKNAQQAGMFCNEPLFWLFLKSRDNIISYTARRVTDCHDGGAWVYLRSKEDAAEAVRFLMGVESRRELDDPEAAMNWRELAADYDLWKRGIL